MNGNVQVTDTEQSKIIQLIDEINSQNDKLKTLESVVDIEIKGSPFSLKGYLWHQKDLNFKMVVNSRTNKELDVGSNPALFWFWSRRMKPPALYYASHEDLYKTRLKTPFHPLWLMECLSVGELKLPDKVLRNEQYILIEETRKSTLNRWVKKKTLIDVERRAVIGHYLVDLNDNGIASAEVLEFQTVGEFLVPKKMKVCWYQENKTLYWTFSNTYTNGQIHPEVWAMPPINETIDMANYFPNF